MIRITPSTLAFNSGQREQTLEIANESKTNMGTYKIEANCSTRFKVTPVIGIVEPSSQTHISVKLKDGEEASSDDRFLVRSAAYVEGDFASPKEFWTEAKKSPNVIPHDKAIVNVRIFDSASESEETAPRNLEQELKEMQSFHVPATSNRGAAVDDSNLLEKNKVDGSKSLQESPVLSKSKNEISADDITSDAERMSQALLDAEEARAVSQPNVESAALATIGALFEKRKDYAQAAAWYEESARVSPNRTSSSGFAQEQIRIGNMDEFSLLVAREEVAKTRMTLRKGGKLPQVDTSSPPPPPPHSQTEMPGSERRRRYEKPTESSMAHRLPVAPSNVAALSDTNGKSESAPAAQLSTSKRQQQRSASKRGPVIPPRAPPPATSSQQLQKKGSEYVLEIVPVEGERDFPVGESVRVSVPSPSATVRQMKDLTLLAFGLNPNEDDCDLLVVGIRLSDHWKASEFGLNPGVTRVEMRRKPRPAQEGLNPAKSMEEESEDLQDRVFVLAKRLNRTEDENIRLRNELEIKIRDLDLVSARLLSVSKDRDRLEEDKNRLIARVAALENAALKVASGPQTPPSSPSKPKSPGKLGINRKAASPASVDGKHNKSAATNDASTALCVVTSPCYLLPAMTSEGEDDEEEEEFFEGDGDEYGPQLSDEGGVSIDGHSFRFQSALLLTSAVQAAVVPEKLIQLLPGDFFDAILDGESQTVIVLGETSAGKSAVLEGFDALGTASTPRGEKEESGSPRGLEINKLRSPNQLSKKRGLVDLLAMHLYKAIAAMVAESAMMGGGGAGISTFNVEVSGFQTFRNGVVIDFLSSTPLEGTCGRIPVPLLADFERAYGKMLRKKTVVCQRTTLPARGDPSDPDSCVVLTFELTKQDEPEFKSRLRIIESCGTEKGGMEANPIVGRIVEGKASVLAVLHPSFVHADKSIKVCTMALEMADRFAQDLHSY